MKTKYAYLSKIPKASEQEKRCRRRSSKPAKNWYCSSIGRQIVRKPLPPFFGGWCILWKCFMHVCACMRDVLCVKSRKRRKLVFHIWSKKLKTEKRYIHSYSFGSVDRPGGKEHTIHIKILLLYNIDLLKESTENKKSQSRKASLIKYNYTQIKQKEIYWINLPTADIYQTHTNILFEHIHPHTQGTPI